MRPSFAVLIGMALLMVPTANAQESPAGPGLGEIMTLQQLRHIKLWFAGRAGNWPLADYEIGELNEGFEDCEQAVRRRHRGQGASARRCRRCRRSSITRIMRRLPPPSISSPPAATAVTTRWITAFIAIQRPTSLPYSNQNFAPQK